MRSTKRSAIGVCERRLANRATRALRPPLYREGAHMPRLSALDKNRPRPSWAYDSERVTTSAR